MIKTRRERYVEKARAVLGDGRLMSFLLQSRATCGLLACKLVNDALNQGISLDAIFYTGNDFGYQLTVRKTSPDTFNVEFGCLAGQEEGDGGQWDVAFDTENQLERIELVAEWMA